MTGQLRTVCLAIACVAISAATAADNIRALLEEALDQTVERIRVEDRPLAEALQQLEDGTGVPFVLDDRVLEYMPYGARTRISLELRDISLRRGLEDLFDGLGLRLEVERDHVRVVPGPLLERLGRRLTGEEAALLEALSTQKWSQLDRDRHPVRYEFERDVEDELEQALRRNAADSALHALEHAAAAGKLVWHPDGRTIVLRSRLSDVQRRLDRPIDMMYQRVPLDELLVDLGRKIGVTMFFEPGSLASVSARDRAVDLIQHDTSVRQTLERICGTTGLSYEVTADGVRFAGPPAEGEASASEPRPWLVQISIPVADPDIRVNYIFRETELPPTLETTWRARVIEILEDLARQEATTGQ